MKSFRTSPCVTSSGLQDVLLRAQALERQGRSREACTALERGLGKNPEQLEWMRLLAYWLFRDGREVELLGWLERGPDSYRRDAYLVLQRASCLARLQKFGKARREYKRVLELTEDADLRQQAESDLEWLTREEETARAVKSGLDRARIGVLAGSLVLAGTGLFLWLARRRERLKGPVEATRDPSGEDPT